jgi:hypothetical protein
VDGSKNNKLIRGVARILKGVVFSKILDFHGQFFPKGGSARSHTPTPLATPLLMVSN